jgi:hypothetical protein
VADNPDEQDLVKQINYIPEVLTRVRPINIYPEGSIYHDSEPRNYLPETDSYIFHCRFCPPEGFGGGEFGGGIYMGRNEVYGVRDRIINMNLVMVPRPAEDKTLPIVIRPKIK